MAITITIFLSSCHVNLSMPMPLGLAAKGRVLIKVSCLCQCTGPGHYQLVYFPWALGGSFLGRISWARPPWSLDTSAMASGTGRKASSALQSSLRKTTAPHHNRSTIQNRTVRYAQSSRLWGCSASAAAAFLGPRK